MIFVPKTNCMFFARQSGGPMPSAAPRYAGSVTNSLAASVPYVSIPATEITVLSVVGSKTRVTIA